MDNNIFFSIIVPVYNVQNYLEKCINSIINQNFKDYELILVDDGSEDMSGKICNDFSNKYDFIITIHKENGGLSDARNMGLKHARGEYIIFIDSDDYIEKNSLIKIYETIQRNRKCDLVFLNAMKIFPNNKIVSLGENLHTNMINNQPKNVVMTHIASRPKFPASAWNKAVSRKLIMDNSLYFEKNMISEDVDWTIRLLKVANTFAYCPEKYYYYRQNRQGSITNKCNSRSILWILTIIEEHANNDISYEYQREINSFLSYELCVSIFNYGRLSITDNKEEVLEKIKEYKWLLKYNSTIKTKVIYILVNIFGFEFVSKILNLIKKD